MDLNISGAITAITASGSCTIRDGKPLIVNFGYVDVEKVNGDNFGRAVYQGNGVECNGTYEGGTPVTVTISGTATSFDNAAIQTSLPGMGLHISAEGKPMTLGVPRSTTLERLNNPFYFRVIAVPVKDPAKTLVANVGFFVASGTMVVNYQ